MPKHLIKLVNFHLYINIASIITPLAQVKVHIFDVSHVGSFTL